MLVQSHDRFDTIADFDPASGRLIEFKCAAGDLALPVGGHYTQLGNTLAVLYRTGSSLWLRLGNHVRRLEPPDSTVLWESLLDAGQELTSVEYTSHLHGIPDLEDDPTPFAEPEDWNFGLFVRNVLVDEGRRFRIYTDDPA